MSPLSRTIEGAPPPLYVDADLLDYVCEYGARQDPVLARIERETASLGWLPAVMQVSPQQGALLELLVRVTGARRALELGTMFGYSAICIARGVGPAGSLLTLEIDDDYAAAARRNLDAAGIGDRVEIVVGPAAESLRGLPADQVVDFAFIDADKAGYPEYYELVLERLPHGGLLVVDNVLMQGRVLDTEGDEEAEVVHALNGRIAHDDRVDCAMVGAGDGMTLVRKR